ncbi:MAG TPA: transcriptional activator NhaR [Candidatus Sulfotelmatobacter sp.]|nr:transcriptional activator NhaR [Candidatus Sulfotelmatobacter sp.]
MEWLNYHHLRYLYAVGRTGSISKASRELHVSSPAISSQLRDLEEYLGEKLLARSGRNLILTEIGRIVFSYAEEIFSLGQELMSTIKERPTGRPLRLVIGVVDVLPKMIAQWLIDPAFRLREPVRIVCREGNSDQLLSQLAIHELDVVLSDVPINPGVKIRAYNHLLGECGTMFAATSKLARSLKKDFPLSLHQVPMLLPGENAAIRRSLDFWLESNGIRPVVAGEFQDYALLRAFGQAGRGVFPIPSVLTDQVLRQDSLQPIGHTDDVRNQFYAISVERRLKHPAVIAICDAARKQLFGKSVAAA